MVGAGIVRTSNGHAIGAIEVPRVLIWLRWLTPPVLALALYSPVVGLPFFWDYVPNFNFMSGWTLADIWSSAAGFPYYRPLGFTAWRLLKLSFGETNTVAHHALNLLALVSNGWLVGAMAMRLTTGRAKPLDAGVFAWSSGAILTAFPFAALAVPLVASLFHLFVALLALAAGVSFLEYIQHGRRRWAIIAISCAALAPFVHESGVAVAGILAVLWLVAPLNNGTSWWSSTRRRGGVVVVVALVLNLLFVLLWLNIPKMRTGGNLPGGLQANELWLNAGFFFISLTFPLQPWALNAQLNWGWGGVP